jgi:ferric-dicitrate binding protein FerR (iron transport regulator)
MEKDKLDELLAKYADGTISGQERKLLDAFYASHGDKASQWQHDNQPQLAHIREEIYANVNARYTDAIKPNRNWKIARIAASILIILGVGTYWFSQYNRPADWITQHAQSGQVLSVQLADGSRVLLNGNSTLSYPEQFTDTIREVHLTGEAHFEVTKSNTPFIVRSETLQTHVLGTTFNIRTLKHTTEVTLLEGKVVVAGAGQPDITLQPNQQALFNRQSKTLQMRQVEASKFMSWDTGVLYFEDTPLEEVVEILSKQFDVNIGTAPNLRSCTVSGRYDNETLDNILTSLRFMEDWRTQKVNTDSLVITGTPCQ